MSNANPDNILPQNLSREQIDAYVSRGRQRRAEFVAGLGPRILASLRGAFGRPAKTTGSGDVPGNLSPAG